MQPAIRHNPDSVPSIPNPHDVTLQCASECYSHGININIGACGRVTSPAVLSSSESGFKLEPDCPEVGSYSFPQSVPANIKLIRT